MGVVRILVTGGAGYIGAHVVATLAASGHEILVVDDLSSGAASRVSVPVVELDVAAAGAPRELARLLRAHGAEAVVHLAARKHVAESVERPQWYEEQNTGGVRHVLRAMADAGVDRLVFSSTAAVYGEVGLEPVGEDAPTQPISPYGQTKLDGERLIAAASEWGLRSACLRFFNAVGAAEPALGDPAAGNLVPIVFGQLKEGLPPTIYGDDWPTPDGTCIRDFVHVCDVAEAHEAALRLLAGPAQATVVNVGTGVGTSVRQMIDEIIDVTGIRIEPIVAPRRPGDSAAVVADVARARRELGWAASRSVEQMVASAWAAHLLRLAV